MTDVKKKVDPFHVKGPDGVIRPLDEHYDGMQDVEQDPYGAWLAIQNLCARLAEVENERDDARKLQAKDFELLDSPWKQRAERAEAALATARRDAFLAGFKASGEGWNGECPYEGVDPLEDKYFVDIMDRELRDLADQGNP